MTGDFSKLPNEMRRALARQLAPGERVLYAARPDWRAELPKLLAILAFGLGWSSIAFLFFGMSFAGLLGLTPATSNGQPTPTGILVFILVFSLPFVAIGLAFLATPFLGIRKSRATVHAVTDVRLLNVFVGSDAGSESYPLSTINFVKRRDRRSGFGSLAIGYGVEKDADGDPRPLTTEWSGTPNVARAEAAIRDHANWAR